MRMLIADDNRQILTVLKYYAAKEGFAVDLAQDGNEALDFARACVYDIVLLDVTMPKLDGFAVCKEIRSFSMMPILMVTARGEDYERIMGLDLGADDYIIKPFSPGEVMARVRAILRRSDQRKSPANHFLKYGFLQIDTDASIVTLQGTEITLTRKEYDLLCTLASTPNKIFSRDNLLNSLWGFDYFGDVRTVDSHIRRLRSKLDIHPHPEWTITTIWRMGYKFEVNPA